MSTWLKRCFTLAKARVRGVITTDEMKAELAEAIRRFVQAVTADGH